MAKWISMKEIDNRGLKTRVFEIRADGINDHLGVVRWYGPWRAYVFRPADDTIFEKTCLRDIAAFCEQMTRSHIIELKEKKGA